jgi:hypothetical protein
MPDLNAFSELKLLIVLQLFELKVEKFQNSSIWGGGGGCLKSLLKKLGTSFEKLICQEDLFRLPL